MRERLLPVLLLGALTCEAQNDVVFPNLWANATEIWPCMDGVYGLIFHESSYEFEMYQPVSEFGLEWGRLLDNGSEVGRIAVDGQRIMFRRIGTSLDHLIPSDTIVELYDFDLAVGDTAYADLEFYPFAVVSQIDTVYLSERPRKRLLISNGDQWIQGIGSIQGLFRPFWTTLGECALPEYYFCADYIDSTQQLYFFCDEMPTGIAVCKEPVLRVFPVPNNGSFVLEGGIPGQKYMIIDGFGRVIDAGRLTSGREHFQLSSFASGFYTMLVGDQRITLTIER